MKNESEWGAKLAMACVLALVAVVSAFHLLAGYLKLDLPFPTGLVETPILQVIMLAVVLLFARHKGASLEKLGLKRASAKTLVLVSLAVVPLFLLSGVILFVVTTVLGPDPTAEAYVRVNMPRNLIQLIAYVIIFLGLVGPIEELAFRGFVQKGFENSFGKIKGLLIASILFGLPHIVNYPSNVPIAIAIGLIIGYIWQRTGGNTTATAVMHGVYNSLAYTLAYLGVV